MWFQLVFLTLAGLIIMYIIEGWIALCRFDVSKFAPELVRWFEARDLREAWSDSNPSAKESNPRLQRLLREEEAAYRSMISASKRFIRIAKRRSYERFLRGAIVARSA